MSPLLQASTSHLRTHLATLFGLVFLATLLPLPAHAVPCTGSTLFYDETGNLMDTLGPNCNGTWCYVPVSLGVMYTITPPGCDPQSGACTVTATVPWQFPGNHHNPISPPVFSFATVILETASGGFIGQCGVPFATITKDTGTARFSSVLSCADVANNPPQTFKYNLKGISCFMFGNCEKVTTEEVDLGSALGCPPPPPVQGCPIDEGCLSCRNGGNGGGGGASTGGSGPGAAPGKAGPGAMLRYRAGGTGHSTYPKPTDWNTRLGRYWSHDYAEAIVKDPDEEHVWLLTRYATFREFTDANSDGFYELVAPSDEYRQLEKTAGGWELRDLDGTLQFFDNSGRWTETIDKNGNAKVATYSGGVLAEVGFPDGRSETFTYHPSGKLATITEVGVDGTTTRTWSYTWNGSDLERIGRPDGTAWKFLYDDPSFPGYLTRITLVGTDASERIAQAYALDAFGNVAFAWQGATTFNSPDAVDRWSLTYDNPALPTETIVRDPLGNDTIYHLDRDDVSRKPKVLEIEGDCPTCSVGPNSQMEYADAAHPLRVTREEDGRGFITRYTWDAHGMMTSRIEAFATPLERETTWEYSSDFPAFVTRIEQPSTSGSPLGRLTLSEYDAAGNRDTLTIEGVEAGSAFSYTTVTTFTPEGEVDTIDPPGHGSDDQTTFTYDPSRGNLVADSRTDPLIGTTTYSQDPFNRRTEVTDPNGVTTETVYDALDRVRFVIQRGAVPADDLITEHRYTVFGDLFQTILPKGNVIEYLYDQAGRLTAIERKPATSPSSHGERTVYQLDNFGHRIREEQQRWNGSAWVVEAATAYQYPTRCHLGKTIAGAGSANESVTEHAYDCNGNLERTWDANHLSNNQTSPATTVHVYDALDRLEEVRQPWGGTGGGNVSTRYEYDVQDHLTKVTDGEGNVTSYVYSDRDLMTRETSTVTGAATYQYDEHGEFEERTDARGITMLQTFDALDRVTFVDYPDDSLDIVYTYDDPAVDFSLGRLTRILRDGHAIDYEYDRFGRMTRDGELTYLHDKNGNRAEIGYPGDVTAVYTFDFADRPASLAVEGSGQAPQPIVTAASYYAAGPARNLTLGNGLTEAHLHDTRYYPDRITVTGLAPLLDWDYTTDKVGNPLAIANVLNPTAGRSYVYQEFQYFLRQGDGPWGGLSWQYDRIGNRLSEVRNGQPADVYHYITNPAGGRDPRLDRIVLGVGGTRTFDYDAAGNEIEVASGANAIERTYDDAGRLAVMERAAGDVATDLLYDGRSFLRHASERNLSHIFLDGFETGNVACWSAAVGGAAGSGACPENPVTEPVYSSEGLLYAQRKLAPDVDRYIFYFAGRPIATLAEEGSSATYAWLSTDHLGTPILATRSTGSLQWFGGFEPFGRDFSGGQAANVFLRFPGQWDDETWTEISEDIYFNVHRWYQSDTGKYTRADPGWTVAGPINDPQLFFLPPSAYTYAAGQPQRFSDPMGLTVEDALCVLKWSLYGAAGGLLAGSATGCAVGAGVGVFAGGVGALPGCGSGAISGGILGAGGGALAGAIGGKVACQCDDSRSRDREKRKKWTCEAKAHVNNFSGVPGAPSFVFAVGSGPTESTACQAAIRAVQQLSPLGTYTRHPHCTRCWRR